MIDINDQSKPRPLDVWAYNEFAGRFDTESDRAAAVLAGGYLDAFMESALRDVFSSSARIDDLFDPRGPLHSLGHKISIAAALGIVPDSVARDMDFIRKVRNHFAHHIWEAGFDASPISDWCKAIEIVDASVDRATGERVAYEGSCRSRYLLAVGMSIMVVSNSRKVSAAFRERMTGTRSLRP